MSKRKKKKPKNSTQKLSDFQSILSYETRSIGRKQSLKTGKVRSLESGEEIDLELLENNQEVERILRASLPGVTREEIQILQQLKPEKITRVIENAKIIYKTTDKRAFKRFVIHFLTLEVKEKREWRALKQEVAVIKKNQC